MRVEGGAAEVAAGQAGFTPPGCTQSVEKTGETDLAFLCIVDPAWVPEVEEILAQGAAGKR